MDKTKRALEVVVRRLRDSNNKYDVEAAWTIGVLAHAFDVSRSEIMSMGSFGYSTVIFANWGEQKIKCIKTVRAYANLGLLEAKEIVEGLWLCTIPTEKAMLIKQECEIGCGANVIIRPIPISPGDPPDNLPDIKSRPPDDST